MSSVGATRVTDDLGEWTLRLFCARSGRIPYHVNKGSKPSRKALDDLAAEAISRALERGFERLGRYTNLSDVVSEYLSEKHCAGRANGCAIAALGSDLGRQGKGVRHGLTDYVRAQLDRFTGLLKSGTPASRRKRAITTLAGMVGALTLARAVDEPALSNEILVAARDAFGGAR